MLRHGDWMKLDLSYSHLSFDHLYVSFHEAELLVNAMRGLRLPEKNQTCLTNNNKTRNSIKALPIIPGMAFQSIFRTPFVGIPKRLTIPAKKLVIEPIKTIKIPLITFSVREKQKTKKQINGVIKLYQAAELKNGPRGFLIMKSASAAILLIIV